MRLLLRHLALLVAFGVLSADPVLGEGRPQRSLRESIVIDGEERSYLLQVPRMYAVGTPVPLVLVFHGGGSSAEEIQRASRFKNLSAEAGFIAAFPQAREDYWNDGRIRDGHVKGIPDDVRFIRELVAGLSRTYTIDQNRIYAAGYSNGGTMALRLACMLPNTFAGVATIAASFPRAVAEVCDPTRPISVLMIHGTQDQVIPWNSNIERSLFIPVEETAKFWARRGGCTENAKRRRVTELDVRDARFIDEFRFTECKPGTEVVLYALVGAGHGWPEPRINPFTNLLLERGVGLRRTTLDSSRLIWEFFGRHRRPEQR